MPTALSLRIFDSTKFGQGHGDVSFVELVALIESRRFLSHRPAIPYHRDDGVNCVQMRTFFETTFGPNELAVVESALNEWRRAHSFTKNDPESELAAAIMIALFREGNNSFDELVQASRKHRGLCDLATLSRQPPN